MGTTNQTRVIGAWVAGGVTAGIQYSRKAKSKGVLGLGEFAGASGMAPEQLEHMFKVIAETLKSGYEINLGGKLRFFACLDRATRSKLEVVATTGGELRSALNDIAFTLENREGKAVTKTELKRKVKKTARAQASKLFAETAPDGVTPDTMVTCPKCGERFRVGKRLV